MTHNAPGHRFRESHVILISKLVVAELLIILTSSFIQVTHIFSSSALSGFIASETLTLTNFILLFFISIVELLLAVFVVLTWANNEYEITDGAIRHRHGLFYTKEEIYSLRNLGSATISQSLFGKLFGYGNIHAYSPILKQEIRIINVHDPASITRHIEDDVKHVGNKHDIFRRSS